MPESLTCSMSKCMILLQCLSILARHRWKKKKKIASCIPRRRLEAIHFPHKARGSEEETFLRLRSFLGQRSQYSSVGFFLNQKILPKALGTILHNNTDKSQLYSTPHTSEPTVLALAGLPKRRRINSQLKITLFQYIQLLRRFGYSVCNSFTKHRCLHLSYLPGFPLQFNREK